MPNGKPAGVPCIHLSDTFACNLFGDASRPGFCADLTPGPEMCGMTREHALRYLKVLEDKTK